MGATGDAVKYNSDKGEGVGGLQETQLSTIVIRGKEWGATGDAVKAIVIRGKEWGARGDAVKAIVTRGKEWGATGDAVKDNGDKGEGVGGYRRRS